MKLITGGAFQGKRNYAMERYHVWDGWVDGADCQAADLAVCRGVDHFHEYLGRLLQQEGEALDAVRIEERARALADRLLQENPELIVVTDELGYGIVPVGHFEREYRELAGRVCTFLAAEAEEVIRVVCGMGMVLKKAQ